MINVLAEAFLLAYLFEIDEMVSNHLYILILLLYNILYFSSMVYISLDRLLEVTN